METNSEKFLVTELKRGGVDFAVSVPCKLTSGLISCLEQDKDITHLSVTREEEGVGICAGVHLSGSLPCMVIQNSGLGNSINALASLTMLYSLPLVMLISHRGTPGEKIAAQFPMGQYSKGLLDVLNIPSFTMKDKKDVEAELCNIVSYSRSMEFPVTVLLDFQFWSNINETV